jgi:hypothetical protein
MKNPTKFFLAIITTLSFSACIKNADNNTLVCEPPVTTYAAFNITDQSTGDDLFFAANPKYQLKDFYAFTTKDKTRHDTIKPKIYNAGTVHVFLFPLDYSKSKDTLILKVANLADDQFAYTVNHNIGPCGGSALDKAYLNGTAIVTTDGKYILKK